MDVIRELGEKGVDGFRLVPPPANGEISLLVALAVKGHGLYVLPEFRLGARLAIPSAGRQAQSLSLTSSPSASNPARTRARRSRSSSGGGPSPAATAAMTRP